MNAKLGVLALAVLSLNTPVDLEAQVLRQPVPDKVVVLTFDDAVASHATYVAPLLKRYGFGATFFVTEFKEPPFSDKTKYMSWEQIRELSEMGFEIGNHTARHTHVPAMDREQFVGELEYIENRGISLGIPKPLSFAYPAYETEPAALEVLKDKRYIFARIGGNRAYDPESDHPYLIPSFSTSGDSRDRIMNAFRQARDGKIVVLTLHGVPDTAHPWVNTSQELFEEYLRFLHEHDYRVLALRDLARFVDVERALTQITPDF